MKKKSHMKKVLLFTFASLQLSSIAYADDNCKLELIPLKECIQRPAPIDSKWIKPLEKGECTFASLRILQVTKVQSKSIIICEGVPVQSEIIEQEVQTYLSSTGKSCHRNRDLRADESIKNLRFNFQDYLRFNAAIFCDE